MRRFVVALLGATALGGAALAADMPVKAPVPIVPIAPPMTWTGFYAGVNLGYGWADVSTDVTSSDLTGVIGGGQVGYNWQTGPLVLGIEGDFQGSGQNKSDSGTFGGVPFTVDQKLPWFATLRGRLGYAAGPWLFYGTGGAAWANYKLSITALGVTASDDSTRTAWTAGGGVEWMFLPKWSAKLEYLYIDTGDTSVTLFGTTFTGRAKDNIVRAGVNYHF
jgi:outer membrane immunogenic protein